MSVVKFGEFLVEGLIGTLVVSILPAMILLIQRGYEKRKKPEGYDSTIFSALQNKLYDKLIEQNNEK